MDKAKFLAKKEDGKQIAELLESNAGNGQIVVAYTRRPDAYESYMREAGDVKVFVDKENGECIKTFAEITREVYIDKKIHKVGYICGLKKKASHEGFSLSDYAMFKNIKDENVNMHYCCVLNDNTYMQNMMKKNRKLLKTDIVSLLTTYMFNPNVKIKITDNNYVFRKAKISDTEKLIKYLNDEGSKKDLFPVIKTIDQFYNLKIDDFYLLLDNDNIICVGSLWDVTPYKQYTIKKYSKFLKFIRIFNPILSALKYISLPKENEPIPFPFISFLLSKDDIKENYIIFLSQIIKVAAEKYNVVGIALPKNHGLNETMKKIKNVSFGSLILSVSFSWDKEKLAINPNNIFTENALL